MTGVSAVSTFLLLASGLVAEGAVLLAGLLNTAAVTSFLSGDTRGDLIHGSADSIRPLASSRMSESFC